MVTPYDPWPADTPPNAQPAAAAAANNAPRGGSFAKAVPADVDTAKAQSEAVRAADRFSLKHEATNLLTYAT